jgi:hypothetical protein
MPLERRFGSVEIKCGVCGVGEMAPARVRKRGMAGLILGLVFMIPGAIGGAFSAVFVVGGCQAVKQTVVFSDAEVDAAGVPSWIVDRIQALEPVSNQDIEALSLDAQQAITKVRADKGAIALGGGVAAGAGFFWLAFWGVVFAIGALLARKKSVLRCGRCASIVDRA